MNTDCPCPSMRHMLSKGSSCQPARNASEQAPREACKLLKSYVEQGVHHQGQKGTIDDCRPALHIQLSSIATISLDARETCIHKQHSKEVQRLLTVLTLVVKNRGWLVGRMEEGVQCMTARPMHSNRSEEQTQSVPADSTCCCDMHRRTQADRRSSS